MHVDTIEEAPESLRWPVRYVGEASRAVAIVDLIDRHSRALFGYALLFGAAVHPFGIAANALVQRPGVERYAIQVGVAVEILIIAAYLYREWLFKSVRQQPVIVVLVAIICLLPMATDNGLFLTGYYNIAFVPFTFACFAGWKWWVVPASMLAASAYLAPQLWHQPTVSDFGLETFNPLFDVAEFFVIAAAVAAISGYFSKLVSRYLARAQVERIDSDPWISAADLTLLTEREIEVGGLLSAGLTNGEIGARLFLSPRTVESHVRSAKRKLNAATRTELAVAVALAMNP